MNFGFQCDCDCGKCSWCCLKEVYAWGSGTTSADTTNQSRDDAPLHGTRDPTVDRQSPWIDVATNGLATWAIMRDGSLWGWGQGPLGDGSSTGKNYPVFIDNGPWVKVFAGRTVIPGTTPLVTQCYAIKQDGSLWGWGGGLPPLPQDLSANSIQIRARLSSPVVGAVITSGGSYSSTPSVSVIQQGGSGAVTSHASVTARMRYSISSVPVTNPGNNYLFPPSVVVSAAGYQENPPDFVVTPARFSVTTRHPIAAVQIASGGSGYESPPQVIFQFGQGSGATAVAHIQDGVVVSVEVTNTGSNYISSFPPRVVFEGGNPLSPASASVVLGEGYVESAFVTSAGHYRYPPHVQLSHGNATISPSIAGVVEGVDVLDGGGGYTSSSSDRPLLQFSHGSAAGYCTLAPGSVHSVSLRPGSVTSVTPPHSDDTTGTVAAGGPFDFDWGGTQFGGAILFEEIVSADIIDGDRRIPLEITDPSPTPWGPRMRFSIASPLTGWKNRPQIKVIAKSPDFLGYTQQPLLMPNNGDPAYQGACIPDGVDLTAWIEALPRKTVGATNLAGFFAPNSNFYAIKNASTNMPATEVRESHGRVATVGTGIADPPNAAITTTADYIGIKVQSVQGVPGWIPPVCRTIDFAANSVNGYGCGAKIRAFVENSGSITPILVHSGFSYTEEPTCAIDAARTAFHPRLIDESGGWSDVAISETRNIGIKSGLLYHWPGSLLGPPCRVGKRLELHVEPKDKHSNGSVGGGSILLQSLNIGLLVDFPQASGGQPFRPSSTIFFTGGLSLGSIIGRYQKPDPSGSSLPGTGGPQGQGGSASFMPAPRDVDFFPEYEGSMLLRANLGHGYLSMPSIEVSEFCDFTVSPELVGPDQCVSVSSADGLWALDSEGVLWEVGPINGRVYVDEPPEIQFTAEGESTATFSGWILPGTGFSLGFLTTVYAVSKTSTVTSRQVSPDYFARISSRGSGYSEASLDWSSKRTFYSNPLPDVTTEDGEAMCGEGSALDSRTLKTSFPAEENLGDDLTPRSASLGVWKGKVYSRNLIKIEDSEDERRLVNNLTNVNNTLDGDVSVSGDGSGAYYEIIRLQRKTFHVTSAVTPNAVPDLKWQWISKMSVASFNSNENFFSLYGKLEDGTIMALASTQDPGDGSSYLNFYPYPSPPSADSSHGRLVIDESGKLYSMGSPVIGPEKVRGSVELVINDPGTGYTEPVLAKFSSQPTGVAVAEAQLNGEVVAAGVTNPGSGWSSPPTASIAGNSQVEVVWGGPVESVSVTNGGAGYVVPPAVRFSVPGIPPESVTASISNGSVVSVSVSQDGGRFRQTPQVFFDPRPHLDAINVTAGGEGYTASPTVVVVGGGGQGAAARSELNGSVDPETLSLTSGGVGYQSAPQVIFEGGGGGSGASASCQINDQGFVESISLSSGGSNYTSPPTIRFQGGGGSGASASCGILGPVARVIITSIGSGYESAPLVFFQGGDGDGAAATAQMALAGSGASATARIDGRVLALRVTNAGSDYQSSPAITFSGGENFKASGQELLDSDFMPRAQARISGSVSSVSVQQAGQNYMTGNIAAHDVNGASIQANPIQFIGPRESGPANTQGSASVFVNTAPGSGIQSVTPPAQDRKFASKPSVIFPNSWPIACRTSLRVAGIGLKPKATHPGVRLQTLINQSSTNFSLSYPPGESITGQFIGEGGLVSGAYMTASIRNFPFDAPPAVDFYCETGSGASLAIPVDSNGLVADVGMPADSPGQNYGLHARCSIRGGVRRVTLPQAVAVVENGSVVAINVTSPGLGYSVPPVVVIHGGGGSGAAGFAMLNSGPGNTGFVGPGALRGVASVRITSGGAGYTSPPQVSFVFNEPVIPSGTPRVFPVWVTDVTAVSVDLNRPLTEKRVEEIDLVTRQSNMPSPTNQTIDSFAFYEDGFLAGVSMPISSSDSPVFLKEVPSGATVQLSAPCKIPAVVSIVRPTWETADQVGNSFVAVRGS